jgi:hypothetical protein
MFSKKYYDKLKNTFRKNYSFNILHNRLILYFVLFLSVINLVGCGLLGDYLLPTFFVLIGIMTSFFSKNMTVILTISLVTSNIIKYATRNSLNEGFEEGGKSEKEGKSEENKNEDEVDSSDIGKQETKVKKPKITENNVEGMQEKYKELMSLQDTILGQMETLEESLSNAENVVKNIAKAIEPE